MEFEWDPAKNAECLARRSLDLADAARIFEGWVSERLDTRRDYPEKRVVAIGLVGGGLSRHAGAIAMSGRRTKPVSRVAEVRRGGRTDFKRLRAMSEEEIMATSPPELADLPPDFWDDAVLVPPLPKQAISLRVDQDVLSWFKSLGPRYQTRMNAVLRAYMKSADSKPRKRGRN